MKRGFSLAELVISITTLIVVMMMVFNLFPSSSVAVHRARQEMHANTLAQNRLEEVRNGPFSALQVGETRFDPVSEDGVEFRTTQTVYPVSGEQTDRILGVRVTVEWDYKSKRRQVTQELYRARVAR